MPVLKGHFGYGRSLACEARSLFPSFQNHNTMLRWVVTFLIIAIIAGIFGFTGIAAGAAGIAKVIFFLFLALVVLALLFGGSIWKKVG